MFKKFLFKKIQHLAIIPATTTPLLIGTKYFDLNTFMGQALGWFKWPNLIGVGFAAIAFAIATFYIIRYTRGYYAERKIPKSWKLILIGVMVTAIAEIGELFCFYEWPNFGLIEANILLAIPHALGGTLIGLGAYFLYKELT